MRTFTTTDALQAAAGEYIGTTSWTTVTQDDVTLFADVTGDHQWIHVDPEQAAQGPFGGTIVHGFLTLALLPTLGSEVLDIQTPGPKINYGLNRVRFPHPLRVGSRIRVRVAIGEVVQQATGTVVPVDYVVEIEGEDKPACVAQALTLVLGP